MSKIDEQIKKLREKEKQLELEKRKTEFLSHILESTKSYNNKDFSEVKDSVVDLLQQFVQKSIESIETGTTINFTLSVGPQETPSVTTKSTESSVTQTNSEKSPNKSSVEQQLSFALDNRHLAGKMVTVANDKNMTIKGKVVGLDAPFILVATETGPIIKVPLEKVSLT